MIYSCTHHYFFNSRALVNNQNIFPFHLKRHVPWWRVSRYNSRWTIFNADFTFLKKQKYFNARSERSCLWNTCYIVFKLTYPWLGSLLLQRERHQTPQPPPLHWCSAALQYCDTHMAAYIPVHRLQNKAKPVKWLTYTLNGQWEAYVPQISQ